MWILYFCHFFVIYDYIFSIVFELDTDSSPISISTIPNVSSGVVNITVLKRHVFIIHFYSSWQSSYIILREITPSLR